MPIVFLVHVLWRVPSVCAEGPKSRRRKDSELVNSNYGHIIMSVLQHYRRSPWEFVVWLADHFYCFLNHLFLPTVEKVPLLSFSNIFLYCLGCFFLMNIPLNLHILSLLFIFIKLKISYKKRRNKKQVFLY